MSLPRRYTVTLERRRGSSSLDEFDSLTDEELSEALDPNDLIGAIRAVAARFEPPVAGEAGTATFAQRRADTSLTSRP